MKNLKTTPENTIRLLVSGHRNPDIDSLAAATALAELRRRHSLHPIQAICPGVLPDRAKFLFERFAITPPPCRNDVYVKIGDVTTQVPAISGQTTLFDAVAQLRDNSLPRLPVMDHNQKYLGMLSSLALLGNLLNIDGDEGSGLTGRRIFSSIDMIRQVLEAEILIACDSADIQNFEVYVAAMSGESFEHHLPETNRELAVIVGDRPDIHLRALRKQLRLLIVTGNRPVEPLILKEATTSGVSILQTQLDSASVIRRLKFSVPVEHSLFQQDELILSPSDRLCDVRDRVLNYPADVIPVLNEDGTLSGVVLKRTLNAPPPFRMILVDHNEIEQSPPGAEELPIVEVVDHHRIGILPTAVPIRFTGDVVGSTCTLVAAMYRSAGESLSQGMAGLLLGGIISDTLHLKSPTTAELDRRMVEWLEKVSGVSGEELMAELMRIDSPLAVKPADEVINGDRKNYTDGNIRFALAQVEESNLELLHQRREELAVEIRKAIQQDNLDFFGLLVTDAVRENSELLAIGSNAVLEKLPYRRIDQQLFALPGVLSRKKQLLPQVLSITALLRQS